MRGPQETSSRAPCLICPHMRRMGLTATRPLHRQTRPALSREPKNIPFRVKEPHVRQIHGTAITGVQFQDLSVTSDVTTQQSDAGIPSFLAGRGQAACQGEPLGNSFSVWTRVKESGPPQRASPRLQFLSGETLGSARPCKPQFMERAGKSLTSRCRAADSIQMDTPRPSIRRLPVNRP